MTETTINTELTRLRKEYLILGSRKPLAVGIRPTLLPLINLNSKESRKVIRLLCNHPVYLANISKGGSRYNLDGSTGGKITPGEMENAKEKLSGNSSPAKEKPTTLKLRKQIEIINIQLIEKIMSKEENIGIWCAEILEHQKAIANLNKALCKKQDLVKPFRQPRQLKQPT